MENSGVEIKDLLSRIERIEPHSTCDKSSCRDIDSYGNDRINPRCQLRLSDRSAFATCKICSSSLEV